MTTTAMTPPTMAAVLLFPEELPLGLEDSAVVSVLLVPSDTPASPEEGVGAEGPLGMSEDVAGGGVGAEGVATAAIGCGADGQPSSGGGAAGGSATASVCMTFDAQNSDEHCAFCAFADWPIAPSRKCTYNISVKCNTRIAREYTNRNGSELYKFNPRSPKLWTKAQSNV